MKKLLAFLFATALTAAVFAQQAAVGSVQAASAPAVAATATAADDGSLTLPEREYDFGKIPQGKPVVHVFEVVNNGRDSLHIMNVQASCGCTTPEWDRQKVQAPGEKTKITVGYNAASEGVFAKQITITYNGTQTKQLVIKGEVWKTPASSAPENKALGTLKD
jgi:hypothetical protein